MQVDSNEGATEAHASAVAGDRLRADLRRALGTWWHHVSGHVPAVVLLTLLTAALHPWHLFERVDGFMMRWVVQAYVNEESSEVKLAAADDRIGVLEVSAMMRLTSLEQIDALALDPATVKRLAGIRPVDRGAMADLLERLALRLGQLPQRERVLAIDVDLAPLDASAPALESRERMIKALYQLRSHAQVVVIALDRATPELRKARNDFMREAGCTQFVPGPAAASLSTPTLTPYGLYFASSWLFQRAGAYPLRFPTTLVHDAEPAEWLPALPVVGTLIRMLSKPVSSAEWPPEFPSLGTLIHLLGKPVAPVNSVDDRKTLTALCEQARRTDVPGSAILEDRIAVATPKATSDLMGHYDTALFNWTLQNSHVSDPYPIMSLNAIGPVSKGVDPPVEHKPLEVLDDEALNAPVLVLSIRGAGSNDRFEAASTGPRSFSGAKLHSLQAASLTQPLEDANVRGALADFGIGLLFVGLLAACAPGLQRLEMLAPRTGFVAAALIPLFIAALLVWFSAWLATQLMYRWDIWFNPALVIAGLALHTYLQRRTEPSAHKSADWSFGVRDSLAAWRARRSESLAAPVSPEVPAAAREHAAPVLHAAEWLLGDLLLTTAVRLSIIAAGVAVLAVNGHFTERLFLMAAVAVLVIAAVRSAAAPALKGPT